MSPVNYESATPQETDSHKMYEDILAVLPDYVKAVHDLPDRRDHYQGSHWLSEAEWDEAKEHTIAYNDVFRSIIENNPHLPPQTIVATTLEVADTFSYSDDVKEMLQHNTFGVLRGMQHEVAFETLLEQLPEDFELVYTDDEDDAHGADFKVRCPNGIVLSIDVKATEHLVEEARERTKRYMNKHHRKAPASEIILFSGFDELDFSEDSPWQPSPEAIHRELPRIKSELLQASSRAARQRTYVTH